MENVPNGFSLHPMSHEVSVDEFSTLVRLLGNHGIDRGTIRLDLMSGSRGVYEIRHPGGVARVPARGAICGQHIRCADCQQFWQDGDESTRWTFTEMVHARSWRTATVCESCAAQRRRPGPLERGDTVCEPNSTVPRLVEASGVYDGKPWVMIEGVPYDASQFSLITRAAPERSATGELMAAAPLPEGPPPTPAAPEVDELDPYTQHREQEARRLQGVPQGSATPQQIRCNQGLREDQRATFGRTFDIFTADKLPPPKPSVEAPWPFNDDLEHWHS